MVSDQTYELCLPVLEDRTLEDEDKTDKLEELLKSETTLSGQHLENAILDVLWRHREGASSATSPPPMRHNILRRPSPASWQMPRSNYTSTPLSSSPRLGVSPLAPSNYVPSSFNRTLSSTASPFTSPRPSPRLAFSSPAIPHSPNLNAYEFPTDTTPSGEIYGDLGSENVDWLVGDDVISNASSSAGHSGLNAAAAEYIQPQQNDMSPYDMLRAIFGQAKSDDEIEAALVTHGYDLSNAMISLMDPQTVEASTAQAQTAASKNAVLIGKSMATEIPQRSSTPTGHQKSGVVCRFWLSTGNCARADCRFSHDLSNHICKYWLLGNCLAGDTCIFSHDPSAFMNRLTLDGNGTPPQQSSQPSFQFQDDSAFPSLGSQYQWGSNYQNNYNYPHMGYQPGFKGVQDYGSDASNQRSRPTSRQARDSPVAPSLDDTEAFPSLGAAGKGSKKHHGKRGGHGHAHKENTTPSSLADVVKMSPSPGPSLLRQDLKKMSRNGSSSSIRNGENSVAAQAIPPPQHVPWLETGEKANKAYLKARQDAIKHGGLRNKFLQSAAQAWNRNDARAAKALSLRGQSENDLMRKAHREAARELYEERNKSSNSSSELYVDLHGLHPEEAVEYLERVLLEHSSSTRPVYAITGTGHHSKNGKDKVGKAIRNFLNEWRYAYREFSVPGDRNNVGGILGVDARSWDRSLTREGQSNEATESATGGTVEEDILAQGHEIGDGKVRLLVRDAPRQGVKAGR